MVGKVLAQYRITEKLGEGAWGWSGMAVGEEVEVQPGHVQRWQAD
jgi:hypothetical protein